MGTRRKSLNIGGCERAVPVSSVDTFGELDGMYRKDSSLATCLWCVRSYSFHTINEKVMDDMPLSISRPLRDRNRKKYIQAISEHRSTLQTNARLLLSLVTYCCSIPEHTFLHDTLFFIHLHSMSVSIILTDIHMYPLYTVLKGIKQGLPRDKLKLVLFYNTLYRLHTLPGYPSIESILAATGHVEAPDELRLFTHGNQTSTPMLLYKRAYVECDRVPILQLFTYMRQTIGNTPLSIAALYTLQIPVVYGELRDMLICTRLCPQRYYPTLKELFICVRKCMALPRKYQMIGVGSSGVTCLSATGCKKTEECPLSLLPCATGVHKLMTRKDAIYERQVHSRIGLDQIDPDGVYHSRFVHSCELDRKKQIEHDYTNKVLTHGLVYEYGGVTFTTICKSLSTPVLLRALTSVAQSIHYLNSQNIVHMDIKPDNIVCRRINGTIQCRLIDFGLSVNTVSFPPRTSTIFHNVYLWPCETMFLSSIKFNSPMEYIHHFLRHCPRNVPRDKQLYKYTASVMYSTRTLSSQQLVYAVQGVDRYQFGILLSHPKLLGPTHTFVQRLLHPNPSQRPPLTTYVSLVP